ncbi:D-lyxose/D-mannose family sugar isomerase [uncultured Tateyamaria sp.]|uniref:D-lyxose/D-mannose family sugar isomerase n=1 Tax=uncultured Tateyamaria sp. TaxID=455651 RepID=UPI002607268C|nr:D-lyxose/D-mannose family sugar isomerase [uncultured Tateyamaria sp.]
MKRSRVNDILAEGAAFFTKYGWTVPPFGGWTPDEMRSDKAAHIRDRGLGWDITDYGQGRFDEMGLFLFTMRNGDLTEMGQQGAMLYAEKLMISRQDQLSPMHRHVLKTEDIINRGGATLVLELFTCDAEGQMDRKADVQVLTDGVPVTLPAGGHLKLPVGASVTLTPTTWHAFWGEGGDCLIHEVSTVNDDLTDNIFAEPIGRFSDIEEDVAPTHLLVSDY